MRTKSLSLLTCFCCLALSLWAQGQTSLVKITDCTTSSSAIGKVGADGTPSCTNPAPGGAASGDLGGTYPSPSVAKINGGSVPATAGVLGTNSSSQPTTATATGIESSRIATATGSANAYVVALSPAITSYTNFCGEFISNFGNTGAATANFNGLGVKNVTKNGITATALASGDIGNGQTVSVCYDGTQLEMMSPVANAPAAAYQGPWPLHNGIPASVANPAFYTATTNLNSVTQAGWTWPSNLTADTIVTFTWTMPHVLPAGSAKVILQNLFANDGTAGHTMTFKVCDGAFTAANVSVTCGSTQNFTTTSSSGAPSTLTFTLSTTPVADQQVVIQVDATTTSGLTANVEAGEIEGEFQ